MTALLFHPVFGMAKVLDDLVPDYRARGYAIVDAPVPASQPSPLAALQATLQAEVDTARAEAAAATAAADSAKRTSGFRLHSATLAAGQSLTAGQPTALLLPTSGAGAATVGRNDFGSTPPWDGQRLRVPSVDTVMWVSLRARTVEPAPAAAPVSSKGALPQLLTGLPVSSPHAGPLALSGASAGGDLRATQSRSLRYEVDTTGPNPGGQIVRRSMVTVYADGSWSQYPDVRCTSGPVFLANGAQVLLTPSHTMTLADVTLSIAVAR